MAPWKKFPPGWRVWELEEDEEEEEEDDEGGGDESGGDEGGDEGGDDEGGGDEGGDDESGFIPEDDGGFVRDDGDNEPSGDSSPDFNGWEDDGDQGDNSRVASDWNDYQREIENDFDRGRFERDREREEDEQQRTWERRQDEQREMFAEADRRAREQADQDRLNTAFRRFAQVGAGDQVASDVDVGAVSPEGSGLAPDILPRPLQPGQSTDPRQDWIDWEREPKPGIFETDVQRPQSTEEIQLTNKQNGATTWIPKNDLANVRNLENFDIGSTRPLAPQEPFVRLEDQGPPPVQPFGDWAGAAGRAISSTVGDWWNQPPAEPTQGNQPSAGDYILVRNKMTGGTSPMTVAQFSGMPDPENWARVDEQGNEQLPGGGYAPTFQDEQGRPTQTDVPRQIEDAINPPQRASTLAPAPLSSIPGEPPARANIPLQPASSNLPSTTVPPGQTSLFPDAAFQPPVRSPYDSPAEPPARANLPPQPTTAPAQAAGTAASAAAAAGGTPDQVYETALNAANLAGDNQTLAQQSPWTRNIFRSTYGEANADAEWQRQHRAELERNRVIYGSREPTAGAAARLEGYGPAPDRGIGAVRPPGPGETARFGETPRAIAVAERPAAAKPPAQAAVRPTGAVPSTAAAQTAAPGASPVGAPGDPRVAPTTWTSVPGQTPVKPGATPAQITPAGRPEDVIVVSDPQGQVKAFTRREWDYAGAEVQRQYNRLTEIPAAAPGGGQRGAAAPVSSFQPEGPVTTIDAAVGNNTPLDSLAALALHNRGEEVDPGAVRSDAFNIAHGINALLNGATDKNGQPVGAWAEAYLNDVGRMAWSREEMMNGRRSDPRQAPVEYIEAWKDAYYGSNTDVPLVKELDQQMINYAAIRTPAGQAFQWQHAFGADGSKGLIPSQINSWDCGPNAFAAILRSRGYNISPTQAIDDAIARNYHSATKLANGQYTNRSTDQFQGYAKMVDWLQKDAGIPDVHQEKLDWKNVDAELAEGRPVVLSGESHYWVVSAKNPQTGEYYAGGTSTQRDSKGNRVDWLSPAGFRYANKPAEVAIIARGDVNPQSSVVQKNALPPPASSGRPDTRAYLSASTRPAAAAAQVARTTQTPAVMAAKVSDEPEEPDDFTNYVRWSAESHGIDPDQVAKVMGKEGPEGWTSVGNFVDNAPYSGMSYGPLQLHYAAGRYPQRGMGDDFTRDTGLDLRKLDPRSPEGIRAHKLAVDYAMKRIQQSGDYHEWYGADKAFPGVGRMTKAKRIEPRVRRSR